MTEKIYSKIYADKCNIVLTGMPGAGKSTIGRLIAKELGREFYDTDELITQSRAKTIPEIFAECGEAGFREIETEIIQKFSCRSGIVIATGGGAVLKKENRDALKMNGKVFFLDRPPELLLPTDDRPLAFSSEEIYKRYEERYSTYVSTADKVVENCGLLTQAVGKILEEFK